jgi:hypothetical protein
MGMIELIELIELVEVFEGLGFLVGGFLAGEVWGFAEGAEGGDGVVGGCGEGDAALGGVLCEPGVEVGAEAEGEPLGVLVAERGAAYGVFLLLVHF